ncbi:MAG TPA: GntR family transcriptional regulator [Paracoccus sp. (in: a-proteobacteria)]|uniref:GntR family transcriptional regulator n=1 Tax=Paracoccus sp. TaxID=267 RepID=UPI002CA86DF6|nr:GntR family transcriptional regulator [Paracoccus sp. (in: a-proteobacteria)]HWL55263.1 GntR family transcriptional regulator [Paracoccus sp. (in: a-proteobacteria)]
MQPGDAGSGRRSDRGRLRSSRPVPSLHGLTEMAARERAYHDLRYRILTGRLAPGTTLLETELAALLSLSRTPVREAVIKLADEGLVDVRPRHGVTVRALSLQDFADILDVFSALEVRAFELAAARGLSAEEARRLERMLDEMENATSAGDIARWSDLDDEFHSEIVALCSNQRLQTAVNAFWGQQYRARMMILPLRPLPVESDAEHRITFAALRSGDRALTREKHSAHRDRADRQQLDLLRRSLGSSGLA